MKNVEIVITKITLSDLQSLDPVTLIMEDLSHGTGNLTITCFGQAWTAYWGGIGDQDLKHFLNSCNTDYIVNKLTNIPSTVPDYDAISREIGVEVDHETLMLYHTEMVDHYGYDWMHKLPCKTNHEYRYLCRIVDAIKEYITLECETGR